MAYRVHDGVCTGEGEQVLQTEELAVGRKGTDRSETSRLESQPRRLLRLGKVNEEIREQRLVIASPFPGCVGCSLPYARALRLGGSLRGGKGAFGVPGPIERVAIPDHPVGDTRAVRAKTVGHDATVPVLSCRDALRGARLREECIECLRGYFAAAIGFAVRGSTGLPCFRRVDPIQANSLPLDFDRVTVNDARSPDQDVLRSLGWRRT